MGDDVILQCSSTKLTIERKICARNKEDAEKIMRKIFNREAEQRCKNSFCPEDELDCNLNHIIGLKIDCQQGVCECPPSDPPLYCFKCTAEGTVDCQCSRKNKGK